MTDPLDIAEPILKAAADKLLELGLDERDAARLMVLFGLQRMTDTACCQQHLAEEMAVVAEMLDDAIVELTDTEH